MVYRLLIIIACRRSPAKSLTHVCVTFFRRRERNASIPSLEICAAKIEFLQFFRATEDFGVFNVDHGVFKLSLFDAATIPGFANREQKQPFR